MGSDVNSETFVRQHYPPPPAPRLPVTRGAKDWGEVAISGAPWESLSPPWEPLQAVTMQAQPRPMQLLGGGEAAPPSAGTQQMPSHLDLVKLLGSGSFGEVYQGGRPEWWPVWWPEWWPE